MKGKKLYSIWLALLLFMLLLGAAIIYAGFADYLNPPLLKQRDAVQALFSPLFGC